MELLKPEENRVFLMFLRPEFRKKQKYPISPLLNSYTKPQSV